MSDPYLYRNSDVLINKLGIRDPDELDRVERNFVRLRIIDGPPQGKFDLAHLRAIHRHLFQDIYKWAGAIRTVEIAKGGTQFMLRQYIQTGMADVHRRIEQAGFLQGLAPAAFAEKAGEMLGDVNHIHPFREGNGRTQFEYLQQLAAQAGHQFRPERLTSERWYAASRAAHLGDYRPMAAEIYKAIEP